MFDQLLAVTDTKTGQVNAELWSLSRLARMDANLHARLRDEPSIELLDDLTHHPAFHGEFQRFLSRHGHRELDFDAYHPTWVEAPQIVLDQLKMLIDRPDEDCAAAELR